MKQLIARLTVKFGAFFCAVILVCALPIVADAKDLAVKLELTQIQPIKVQEIGKDELVFNISEYTKHGLKKFYQVPKKPKYLASTHLDKVKNLPLWHKVLKSGEDILLFVSLMEKDNEPWDLDDIIGLVSIRLKNDQGHLTTDWHVPNSDQLGTPLANINHMEQRYLLKRSDAIYQVDLQLST